MYGTPKHPIRSLRQMARNINRMLMQNLLPDNWVKIPIKRVNLMRSVSFISVWLGKITSSSSWRGAYRPRTLIEIAETMCKLNGVDFINLGGDDWDDLMRIYVENVKQRDGEREREWIRRATVVSMVFLDMLSSIALIDIFSEDGVVEE